MSSRVPLNVRVAPGGLDKIDKIAVEAGATRSDVARALLGAALGSPTTVAEVQRRLAAERQGL